MGLTSLIPLKHWLAIGAVVALVVAGNMALDREFARGVAYQKNLQAQADQLFADLRNADKERIEDDTKERISRANAARDRAAAANTGLQSELAAIKRIAVNGTGAIAPGGTARDAVVLLADMLGQCADRYHQMAGFADKAHDAGKACAAQYNSLRTKLK